MAWSEQLARFAALLSRLQKSLSADDEYKAETPVTVSDLNAQDTVYYAGDANTGAKTISINLPNDEEVQQGGPGSTPTPPERGRGGVRRGAEPPLASPNVLLWVCWLGHLTGAPSQPCGRLRTPLRASPGIASTGPSRASSSTSWPPASRTARAYPALSAAPPLSAPPPSGSGDHRSQAILRPVPSPKCPGNARKRPLSPSRRCLLVGGAAATGSGHSGRASPPPRRGRCVEAGRIGRHRRPAPLLQRGGPPVPAVGRRGR